MSLIQEALEKAGRLPAAAPKPVPVEEKTPLTQKEAKIEKMPSAKTEPLWFVGLKVKWLGIMDKIRMTPFRPGKPPKAGFIAAGLIVLFLGAVFYGHTTTLKPSQLNDSQLAAALGGDENPVSHGASGQASIPDFELTGITSSRNAPLALINNQVVGVGERLKENATVLEIQNQKAVLDFQGKRIELEL